MAQKSKSTSELKGVINFTTTSNTKYMCFRLGISSSGNTVTYKNIMLLKGTYTVDNILAYEKYGVSPSPDYPSEIETVKDSVEINVVNKNLFDGNKAVKFWRGFGAQVEFVENVFKVNNTHQSLYSKAFKITNEVKNLTLSVGDIINITSTKARVELCTINEDGTISNRTAIYQNQTVTKNANAIYFNWSSVGAFTVKEIIVSVYEDETTNDYIPHQSQTAIMPIQQEMLTGDYVADIEHHEWKKIVLTGEEELGSNFDINGSIFFGSFISDKDTNNEEMVCNNYLYQSSKTWQQISNYGFCGQIGSNNVFIRDDRFTNKTDFLNYLKQQYEAGTPVTIYCKLAEPVDLPLTSEQKVVRDTKLYTYKNTTNIDVSDELASIDVTYKKDLETMFNNIIKQMSSSTSDTTET